MKRRSIDPVEYLAGVDLSYTRTGIATVSGCHHVTPKAINADDEQAQIARLNRLTRDVIAGIDGAFVVGLEGIAPGSGRSNHSQSHKLGGLYWAMRVELAAYATAWITVPPTTLKKFATGRGNADKSEVLLAAARHGSPATNDDESDAWWLFQIVATLLLPEPLMKMPKANTEALKVLQPQVASVRAVVDLQNL